MSEAPRGSQLIEFGFQDGDLGFEGVVFLEGFGEVFGDKREACLPRQRLFLWGCGPGGFIPFPSYDYASFELWAQVSTDALEAVVIDIGLCQRLRALSDHGALRALLYGDQPFRGGQWFAEPVAPGQFLELLGFASHNTAEGVVTNIGCVVLGERGA